MATALLPSGEQIELRRGDQHAVIVEVGGALRSYRSADWEVVDGFGRDEMSSGGRGQPLMPWPNRLRDGRYEFRGESFQLSLSEPPTHNAIHGLVRWANWTVAERGPHHVRMEHTLHAQSGYPFVLALSLRYSLDADGLRVQMRATNRGERACPFGAGVHPYVSAGTTTIDSCRLRIPARRRLITDDRSLPTGSEAVSDSSFDFRAEREIGSAQLDTAYYELERADDGRIEVVLSDPSSGRTAALWADERFPYLMVFTGDALPQPERRRRGLAIEPMTCAPDAFNSGDGLLALEPGETFTGVWGITPRRR